MAENVAGNADIVGVLQTDHNEVRALFARLETTPVDQRGDLFSEIVSELARHETAEEMIVYPTLRDAAPRGDQVAEARLTEEQEAEELMAAMEDMDPTSDEFLTSFQRLREEVEEHASHEEQEVFPRLREYCDAEQRSSMADRFNMAKKTGPTHPHPDAPNRPPGLIALGPVASLFDRARDAARNAMGG